MHEVSCNDARRARSAPVTVYKHSPTGCEGFDNERQRLDHHRSEVGTGFIADAAQLVHRARRWLHVVIHDAQNVRDAQMGECLLVHARPGSQEEL